jgi:hypothetical protein
MGEMKASGQTPFYLAAVWLHHDKACTAFSRPGITSGRALLAGAYVAAALGALAFCARAVLSTRRLAPSLACASLLGPPLLVAFLRPECDYVIGKLVVTLAPVLVLFHATAAQVAARHWPHRKWALAAVMSCWLLMIAGQSAFEQRAKYKGGGAGAAWNDPDLRRLCDALGHREPADLVIALPGDGTDRVPSGESGALCYYARHHRIRLAAPQRIWMTALSAAAPLVFRGPEVAPGTLVVRRHGEPDCLPLSGGVVENYGKYELVRVTGPAPASGKPSAE